MKKLTGYPSIDNIHNGDYSFFSRNPIIPNMSIYNTINLISNFYRKEEAIDCLDLRVNYDEMIKDAITLSKTLKELGIKNGSIVSAAMPNYYQGVIIYLACNRIGAITTFINSMSSIEEVLGYLNEFESSLFINFDKDKEYNKKIKDGSKVRNVITLHSNEISTKNYDSIETGANGYNDDLSFSDIGSIAKYYKKPIIVFSLSFIISAIIEYATSFYLELTKGMVWWDYSKKPFNINGRICLLYTLIFALFATILYYFVIPKIIDLLKKVNYKTLSVISIILLSLYLVDNIYSYKKPNIVRGAHIVRKN